jgi:RHS repeat-associated protein
VYDTNGNQTTVNGQTVATYDDQDRLLTYGQNRYTYTIQGQLDTKTTSAGTTRYGYDGFGNLRDVTLPDGTAIHYIVDGRNRRVGKEVNGKLQERFLYLDQIRPIAELSPNGMVSELFIYGTRANVPDYIIKDGHRYRVIADQLGSPRLIVDANSGAIVEQIDYDAWGNVTNDTNPGFQPFGFAGGLYDQDTKLIRFGARDYDPETGRWTSKDTMLFAGGETSLYGYVRNDPVNDIDLTGEAPITGYPLPIGAMGTPQQIAQNAEAQIAEKQADARSYEEAGAAAACLANTFVSNYNTYQTGLQRELGPIETLGSLENFGKESGRFLAETTAEHGLTNLAIKFADKGSIKGVKYSVMTEGVIKTFGEVTGVVGAGLDFGDLLDATYFTATGSNSCCP